MGLQILVPEFLRCQGRFDRRRSLNRLSASEKEGNDIVLGAGRHQFAILDANEGAVHRAADCLGFFPFLRAEGVAELPALIAELEMEPAVSFLENWP